MKTLRSTRFYQLKMNIIFFVALCLPLSAGAKLVVEDSDGDGLSDQYEMKVGTEAYLSDTDGDGINDAEEIGDDLNSPLNTDGDRLINALDYDDDNDGLPSILESKADADGDGLKNYLDTDSDNDGIFDGIEAGLLNQDKNHDFIDDAFDADKAGAVDKNGDGINDLVKLPDQDEDGIPDYLDADTTLQKKNKVATTHPKKKKNEDVIKSKKPKLDMASNDVSASDKKPEKETKVTKKAKKKRAINRYTDTDNDGLLNTIEERLGTDPYNRDSDNDKVSDAIEIGLDINVPQDSDHDGIIDALDADDDNDLVLTKDEDINKDGSPINDDTDNDGVPNYLDDNDDGDTRLTIEEGTTIDIDNDGIPDYLDVNDGFKDIVTVLKPNVVIPKEPEIVVLFDGSADSFLNEEDGDSFTTSLLSDAIEKENGNIKEGDVKERPHRKARKVASSSWSWQLF